MVGIPKVRLAVKWYRLGESRCKTQFMDAGPSAQAAVNLELITAHPPSPPGLLTDGGAAAGDRQHPDGASRRSNQLVTVGASTEA